MYMCDFLLETVEWNVFLWLTDGFASQLSLSSTTGSRNRSYFFSRCFFALPWNSWERISYLWLMTDWRSGGSHVLSTSLCVMFLDKKLIEEQGKYWGESVSVTRRSLKVSLGRSQRETQVSPLQSHLSFYFFSFTPFPLILDSSREDTSLFSSSHVA